MRPQSSAMCLFCGRGVKITEHCSSIKSAVALDTWTVFGWAVFCSLVAILTCFGIRGVGRCILCLRSVSRLVESKEM